MAYEKVTWREQRVRLAPSTPDVVYFNDTKPNHILISNPTSSAIYIGVNGNVNASSYDMIIPPYATKLYARMMGVTRLYMYTDNPDSVLVQVTSWAGDFDPASVAQSTEMVGAGAEGLLGIVEINNILSSLPAGTNVLGGVFISSFGASLPSGNNKIGNVGLVAGTEIIGKVMVESLPQDSCTSIKVTASEANKIITVKATPGFVYQVVSSSPDDIQLMDGANEAWAVGNFNATVPLACNTDIRIKFTQPGDAYVLFK